MSRLTRIVAAVTAAAVLPLTAAATPANAARHVHTSTATGSFYPGSGLYLANPNNTDGLSKVWGAVTFSQKGAGATIRVSGQVGGLAGNTLYVAVPYKDPYCTPVPGVTAFPSGSFKTNAIGIARIPSGVVVNPAAINPLGTINVTDTKSVSIRQVILTPVPLPVVPGFPGGVPAGTPIVVPSATPTVPNVAAVEGCDRTPVVRN